MITLKISRIPCPDTSSCEDHLLFSFHAVARLAGDSKNCKVGWLAGKGAAGAILFKVASILRVEVRKSHLDKQLTLVRMLAKPPEFLDETKPAQVATNHRSFR
jgi:hypothetical protein